MNLQELIDNDLLGALFYVDLCHLMGRNGASPRWDSDNDAMATLAEAKLIAQNDKGLYQMTVHGSLLIRNMHENIECAFCLDGVAAPGCMGLCQDCYAAMLQNDVPEFVNAIAPVPDDTLDVLLKIVDALSSFATVPTAAYSGLWRPKADVDKLNESYILAKKWLDDITRNI